MNNYFRRNSEMCKQWTLYYHEA